MKENLVLLDTDHIKRYVFATDKLKEIRGASALFDELNRITMSEEHISQYQKAVPDMTKKEIEEKQVYANGGAGMFWVPDGKSEEFIHRIQQQYREKTVTGSITGVSVPESAESNEPQLLQRLFLEAQIAKAKPPCIQTINSHPLFKPCASCGEEYAETVYEDELLCKSCIAKRKRDEEIKDEIREEITRLSADPSQDQPKSQKLWHRLLFGVKDHLDSFHGKVVNRPEDLNRLGDLSSPSNYIALLYADGNNMGMMVDKLSVAQLGDFSTAVDDAIRKAVVDAMLGPLWPVAFEQKWYFPFDILLLGGDDLVMVTTADKAIETAITITKSFYTQTESIREMVKEQTGEVPTLSVSVVFVHAKFPFATSLSLAESALKFAKKGLATLKREQPDASPQGMINFMVVHSSNTLDFKTLYDQELCNKEEQIYRTLRPYPVDKMERLRNAIKRTLHGIPKTKLHQIREAIYLEKRQSAALSTFAALVRAKEHEKEDILKIVQDFAKEAGYKHLEYPWYMVEKDGEEQFYTPLLDAIELYDFIE